ncbi:nuclear fragile X mental retardation-interacting protein 1-domain-containing protein [Macrophomina phaseolina]|uniref:Nuclear fragile X mental retardation-interacting protein 1-domain-containing protein n=1 Tax=Macrophomina phaseolina TaxID=35725 RepID=A0ABQ8GMB1_9PEZI|nr:nuclear fragile X mental retardation-interacting protein 1-domain-containing protein [Macrophomina phaseolina]
MGGFSFPPPPPPPPKANAQDASSATYQTQPGAYGQRPGRGGGDRGRGRGRGRGNHNRGGFSRGGATNNYASNQSVSQQRYASTNGSSLDMAALPAGGYINPAFAPMYANVVNRSAQVPQPWIAQSPSGQSAGYLQSTTTTSNTTRPLSIHRPPTKPKVQAAPSVPSFGFALPTTKPQVPPADNNDGSKNRKRKHNQLGLTPRSDVHEDSEDDADEEARFQATGEALHFEYKGRSSTLKSAEDIAAWIEERKRRFPTKERIAQKQKEEEERKRAREQAQAEKRLKYQTSETQTKKRKRKDGDGQDKAIRKAEKLREKLRKAEEAVAKAKGEYGSQNKDDTAPKRSLVINYDSEDSADQTGEETSSLNESSSEVSTDSDSDDSSSSDNDSDDNPPPEEESSAKRPLRVHLPNRKAPPTEASRPRQDRHKQEPKRMTLRERMLEQQRRQEAELALRAIKLLGQSGMLG